MTIANRLPVRRGADSSPVGEMLESGCQPPLPPSVGSLTNDRLSSAWTLPSPSVLRRQTTSSDLDAAIAGIEAWLEPISRDLAWTQLTNLALVCKTASSDSEEAWEMRHRAYLRVLGHYPAALWGRAAMIWARTETFYPATGDLARLMEPDYAKACRRLKRAFRKRWQNGAWRIIRTCVTN